MSLTALAWVFTLGVLAHNVEEALYLPAWSVRAGRWHVAVGSNEFRFAVVVLSVALVCITAAASLADPGSPAAYVLSGYVFAMVLNVVAPHCIATVAMRRYMPGTATAVLFNLPLGCLFLARALSEDFIQLDVFLWSAPLVAIAIVASIPVLFAVGRKISLGRSPLKFFLLVFALSIPFWLIGGMSDLQLMPGLSVSALAAFCPMVAALILVHRTRGASGVTELLSRSFDFKRIRAKRWYAPILFLMAGVNVVVYGLMRWMDMPLPAPQIGVLAAPLMFLAFFVGALGEELGWSGYITDPMQDRWNALQTGALLGLVSALWHLVPLLLMHRSPSWIAWWCLYAVAARILIVWLYNNTGKSVFAVALFHATVNLAWMLFPVYGSHFDIRLGGLVMAGVAVTVTVVWGPQTLARYRCASSGEP